MIFALLQFSITFQARILFKHLLCYERSRQILDEKFLPSVIQFNGNQATLVQSCRSASGGPSSAALLWPVSCALGNGTFVVTDIL